MPRDWDSYTGRKNEFASNLPCANMLQYEICKALQPVQRWQSPNLPVFVHWLQSFANFIFATYLHKANLMQIRFFVLCYGIMVPCSDTGMTINPFSIFILDEIEILTASWF